MNTPLLLITRRPYQPLGILIAGAVFIFIFSNSAVQAETMSSGGAPPPRQSSPSAAATGLLQARLVALAKSQHEKDHLELRALLGRQDILDQLDSPEERNRSRTIDLRLATVLAQLQSNRNHAAAQTLISLSKNAVYTEDWQRQELLIRALAHRRPLPAETIAFFDEHSGADSVNLHVAIEALCENGSDIAIKLLTKKMADASLDSVYKIGWMRGPILVHRRDPILLSATEAWLQENALSRDLQLALAEALFDYQPYEWYPGREDIPRPPAEAATSSAAAAIVQRIGQTILRGNNPPAIQAAVRQALSKMPSHTGSGRGAGS